MCLNIAKIKWAKMLQIVKKELQAVAYSVGLFYGSRFNKKYLNVDIECLPKKNSGSSLKL